MSEDQATVLIRMCAKEGYERAARDALLSAISTSSKPGLISSRQYEEPDDRAALYAVQVWDSAEAFHAHLAHAAATGMAEAISVLAGAPTTTILREIDDDGLDTGGRASTGTGDVAVGTVLREAATS